MSIKIEEEQNEIQEENIKLKLKNIWNLELFFFTILQKFNFQFSYAWICQFYTIFCSHDVFFLNKKNPMVTLLNQNQQLSTANCAVWCMYRCL